MQNFRDRMNRYNRGIDTNYLLGLGLAALAVITLWWTPVLLPFRIFTTTIHEASHALTALITGGRVVCFEVETSGAGLTCTVGGWGFLVSSAGYLGSTLFGGLLLIWAKKEVGRRRLLYGLMAGLIIILLLFVVNILNIFSGGVQRDLFTLVLVGLVAALFGLVAYNGPDWLVTFFVYVTALLSTLYAVFDMITLVFLTTNPLGGHNDARNLQQFTGIPAVFWAVIWSLLAVFILWQVSRIIFRPGKRSGKAGSGKGQPGSRSPFDSYEELKRR